MKTYIYRTSQGIFETNDKAIALSDAEEPILVQFTDDEGQIFLSVIE